VQRLRSLGIEQLRTGADTTSPHRRHTMTDTTRRTCGGQAPAREELAILHQELRMDPEPRDRQPAQDVPMQE
jgi:hypothetical protein